MTSDSLWDNKFNALYVADIIFYSIMLIVATVMHFKRKADQALWRLLGHVSAIKIAGVSMLLNSGIKKYNATVSNDPSKEPAVALIVAGSILVSVSTAPLLYSTRILLPKERSFDDNPKKKTLDQQYSRVIILVSVILSIVGYSYLSGDEGTAAVEKGCKLIRAASIIYIFAYLSILGIGLFKSYKACKAGEVTTKVPMYFVLMAFPFFLVRFIYMIIASFATSTSLTTHHKFSVFNGDWQPYAGMFLVMNYMVLLLYTMGGFYLKPEPTYREKSPATSESF